MTLWGPNQRKNEPDCAVDVDERLTRKNVAAGRYDVKLADKKGRVCIVRNLELEPASPTPSPLARATSPTAAAAANDEAAHSALSD